MTDDSAQFAIYNKYKKSFELEVLFAGSEFERPQRTLAKLFVDGLRPIALQETVRALRPSDLADADSFARGLLPAEQALSARLVHDRGKEIPKAAGSTAGGGMASSSNTDSSSKGNIPPDPNSKSSKIKAAKLAAQSDDPAVRETGRVCFKCGEPGHIRPDCPLGAVTPTKIVPTPKVLGPLPKNPPPISIPASQYSKRAIQSVISSVPDPVSP